MRRLGKRPSVCLGFICGYGVLRALVGGHGHIGKGLEGQQDTLAAYVFHFLYTNSIVSDFNQYAGWK
jgi:hypothetical protein